MNTFRNPAADVDTADPFVTYDPATGYYYALFTRGNRLEITRSRHVGEIGRKGETRVIYTPNLIDHFMEVEDSGYDYQVLTA